MSNFIMRHKTEILISIACGVIVLCIQPLISLLGKAFIAVASGISTAFSDLIYKTASKNDPNLTSSLVLIIIVNMVIIWCLNQSGEVYSTVKSIGREFDEIKSGNRGKNAEDQDIDSLMVSFEKRYKTVKLLRLLLLSWMGCVVLACIISQGAITSINKLNGEFNQKINYIAPYVNNTEILKLKSSWADMKSKSDFDKINEAIKGYVNYVH